MKNIGVSRFVNRCVRRVVWEALNTESTGYSQIIDRISAWEPLEAKFASRQYREKILHLIGDCLRFSWHRSAIGGIGIEPRKVTLPGRTNRAERFIALEALRVGAIIGERHRHGRPTPTH
jgi:hypothetical protein